MKTKPGAASKAATTTDTSNDDGNGGEDGGEEDVDVASLIADLEAGRAGEGDAKPAKGGKGKAAPAKKPASTGDDEDSDEDDDQEDGDEDEEDDSDDEGEGDDDEEDDEDEDSDDEQGGDEDDDEDDDEDLDPATRRKLAVVQKAELRHKKQVERDKAELARLVSVEQGKIEAFKREWEPKITAAQKFEQAVARAKRDPVGLLIAAGFNTDEIEEASKQAYLYAKGDKDPKTRGAAQRMQREREQSDDVTSLRKELDELKSAQAAEKQQAAIATKRERFTDSLVAAAKSAHKEADDKSAEEAAPVVAKMLAKNATKARARLFEIADEMGRESGEPPDPADVVAELEKRRRAELEEDGVDLATYLGAPVEPKKKSKTLGKTGGGTKTKGSKVPKSDDDLAAEVAREIAEGRHLA